MNYVDGNYEVLVEFMNVTKTGKGKTRGYCTYMCNPIKEQIIEVLKGELLTTENYFTAVKNGNKIFAKILSMKLIGDK